MVHENAQRHLTPVRDHLESIKKIRVSQSYISQKKGEPTALINVDAEFIGAYLLDDKLIVMMKFDDTTVNPFHVDVAYDAIRKRTKTVLRTHFPTLLECELGVHVVDCSGNLVDLDVD